MARVGTFGRIFLGALGAGPSGADRDAYQCRFIHPFHSYGEHVPATFGMCVAPAV